MVQGPSHIKQLSLIHVCKIGLSIANKMAVNTAKTKYIIFRTRGKKINPGDCHLVYNGNKIGMPEIKA
jgi:hypothetical protein